MKSKEKMEMIGVWSSTKELLDQVKVHHQQSYDDLIKELIKVYKEKKEVKENDNNKRSEKD